MSSLLPGGGSLSKKLESFLRSLTHLAGCHRQSFFWARRGWLVVIGSILAFGRLAAGQAETLSAEQEKAFALTVGKSSIRKVVPSRSNRIRQLSDSASAISVSIGGGQ